GLTLQRQRRFVRREIFSLLTDKELAGTKDFALKQGGKRGKGRSILRYVTDFTRAANAAAA
ncbi:hypothetical protein, partial [Pantoea septica]|uniref:hypothetical protein n=1 Tax=Pantoea septica TaxID=472695 RepID=UPI0028AC4BC6